MKTREFLKSIAAFLALLMSQTTEGYCSPEWMAQASEGAALPAEAERAIGNLDFNSNDLTLSSTNLSTSLADMLDGLNGVRVDENNLEFRIIFESDILFDFDKANIRESALPTLKIAAGALEQFRGKKIHITGHTDSKGTDEYNLRLSIRRARSVTKWLSSQTNLNGFVFQAEGKGEAEPIVPNTLQGGADNPEGRQKNRRVEIRIPKA